MALEENGSNNGMVMPVAPMYGGYGNNGGGFGFGGDGLWFLILFFLLAGNGGWGMGGFGGFGANNALGYDFPWLLNGQNGINANTNNGFQNALLNDGITSIRDGISGLSTQLCGCCGDMQMAMANGFAGVNQGVANGFAGVQQSLCNGFAGTTAAVNAAQTGITQQLYSNELASLNRSFAEQTANTAGFTGVNSGIADLRYTVATENCADRTAAYQNTRDIIDSQTRGTQAVLDKLCQLELDGVRGQLAQAQRENVGLQNQLNMANLAASQTAQNALIQQGFSNEVDALYNRLNSCPVPTTPVYGRTPIFTCGNNNMGCGCGGFAN